MSLQRITASVLAGLLCLATNASCASKPTPTTTSPSASSSPSASASATATPTPSPTPTQPGPPVIRAYDLPGGMIEAGYDKIYTRVGALIAVPSGSGRHPVVVIFHGSYPSCIDFGKDKLLTTEVQTVPWPEGCPKTRKSQEDGLTSGPDYVRTPSSLAYLALELAKRGFAVVIPDVNSKERLDWGTEPDPKVLQTNLGTLHLGLVKRLDEGDSLGLTWGSELKGRLDTSKIGVVGHSSGGGYVIESAYESLLPGIRAAVAIEPAVKSIPTAKSAVAPTLALIGQCDEQIPGDDTTSDLAQIAKKNPTAALVSATLANATHIGTLTGGGSHKIGLVMPSKSAACQDSALLDKSLQRAAIAQITADFMEEAFAGKTSFTIRNVTGTTTTAKSLSGATVSTAPTTASPAAVDPKSITYTASSTQVLPPKPANLVLNSDKPV